MGQNVNRMLRKDVKQLTEHEIQELARQERNKYFREWRAKNKDRVKATNARYWARRAAKLAAKKAGDDGTEIIGEGLQ